MAHTVIAFKSILKGMDKLIINLDAINEDLEHNWAVVAEGIQTILRREAYPNPYEALKALTRTNKPITEADIKAFIEGLDVPAGSQGRAPQAFAADLYRRVQILKPFLRDAMSHSIKYRIR